MGSCGIRMCYRPPCAPPSRRGLAIGRCVLRFAITATSLCLLASCASVKQGTPPRVEQLASLTRGVSGPGDILLVLGEPRGHGVARFMPSLPPRDIWLYEYNEAESGSGRVYLAFLLVFLEHDRYDGHLWFASTQRVEKRE